MLLVLAIALCLALGYLIVAIGWPNRTVSSELPVQFTLSAGCGLGAFSVLYFGAKMLNSDHLITIDVVGVGVLLVALLIRRNISNGEAGRSVSGGIDLALTDWLGTLLAAAFAIALCAAIYSLILRAIAHPQGDGWDAFAIWNLHARFLFRGGADWRNGFTAMIPWSHPDYPLLLPAAVAYFWTILGSDSSAVPAVISVVFAAGVLALLYFSLNRVRGRNAAMLGTFTLASTPFFIQQGSAQYADVPLSFFYLATTVLFCLHDVGPACGGNIWLAGMTAGFAAWTKNEGLLFFCAALLARLLTSIWHNKGVPISGTKPAPAAQLSTIALFLVGALPILMVVFWFKHSVAPPGDLFSAPGSMLRKLISPGRYWAILRWYFRQFFRFGNWWIVPGTVVLAALYFLGASRRSDEQRGMRTAVCTLGLTLAGYFVIYLITPYDIYWHLRMSLSRLLLQVWPSVVFLFFLSLSFDSFDCVSK